MSVSILKKKKELRGSDKMKICGCHQILPLNNCVSWDPELKVIFSLIQDVKRQELPK